MANTIKIKAGSGTPTTSNIVDKEDYYFISEDAFKEMVSNEEFIEYERYGSFFYGTSKNEITKSDFTILDLEVNGATKLLSINSKLFVCFLRFTYNISHD